MSDRAVSAYYLIKRGKARKDSVQPSSMGKAAAATRTLTGHFGHGRGAFLFYLFVGVCGTRFDSVSQKILRFALFTSLVRGKEE